eukprot:CAMPEP_0178945470 /NCGR_PEP_ID=MMETSP0789-20121207/3754_1 /TAXON_ID=3005 /ORGANISM="Rhizosolenia setigera, Strain CCMP 1694" /LENGTH=605 /DNA_ID=CAMNT_0020625367 /DNA_START=1 /DNA_END=1818 /DNA_ORIENTATION=+
MSETKPCSACSEDLPKENFSKKQWQAKKQRRCISCVESNREIQPTKPSSTSESASSKPSTSTKSRKKKKEKPVFAGDMKSRYKNTPNDLGFSCQPATDICSWCGKAEEEGKKLDTCSGCKNALYCSRDCQKAAFPEHKLVCEQMKGDRKAYKATNKKNKNAGSEKPFTLTEASGVGSIGFNKEVLGNKGTLYSVGFVGELRGSEEPGEHFPTPQAEQGVKNLFGPHFSKFVDHMRMTSLQCGSYDYAINFTDINELAPIDQFLFSCGPLNDIDRAKKVLPYVLHQISISGLKPDGSVPNIGDITVRGYSLNALEWASRRGNYAIAEWLSTDERTKIMLTRSDSAPVAWACYTNKVELARMLVKNGANSRATTETVWVFKPATHLASENGSFLALKFLVEECGNDINECDTFGNDIRASLRVNNKAWARIAGCVACDDYAKELGVGGKVKSRKTTLVERVPTPPKKVLEDNLASALNKLSIAGGNEDEDPRGENDIPSNYLDELLAVADARYSLGDFDEAGSAYYKSYYAAMHKSNVVNDPAIFPIAHKMISAWMKTGNKDRIKLAHGMAQQTCMMGGYPSYIQDDLMEVEALMRKKGIPIERFGF